MSLSATATDPAGAADPLTFTWTITRPDSSTFTLSGASNGFAPADNGTYGVSLTVSDGDGGSAATQSVSIIVVNDIPAAAITVLPETGHSPEGTAISLGSSVTDPSPVDAAAGFSYAWSVTKNGVAYAAGTAADFSFTPNDNGTYVVTLTATDKDGGASQPASATITVDNVAPTLSITGAPATARKRRPSPGAAP